MNNDSRRSWWMVTSILVFIFSGLFAEEFAPAADTYVKCGGTYDNYGSDETVYVRQVSPTGDPQYNRHGFIKFDLTSYTGSIDTARLHLNVYQTKTTDSATPATAHFWLLDDGDDGWEEASLDWATAPVYWDSTNFELAWANTPGTKLFDFVFGFHGSGDPDTTYIFDVTDAVAADANGIISFFIADTAHNKTTLKFHSKENTVDAAPAMLEVKEAVVTAVEDNSHTPSTFSLQQNYPNPFNPETSIGYTLNHATEVTITVYDILGKEVTTLVSGHLPAGEHSVVWNGTDKTNQAVPSGVYFCKMAGSGQVHMIKMVLMK